MSRPMVQNLPLAYGCLDSIEEQQNHLIATGWLLRRDGPFDEFRVELASGEILPAEIDVRPRLAEAIPQVTGAERGGFRARVPFPDRDCDEVEFTVVGLREGRPAGNLTVGYYRERRPQTFPPQEVMRRANGNVRQSFWRATGIKACHDLLRALTPHIDLDEVRRLLDWGCSAGRVTVHLIDRFPQAEVFGTDIDVEAVEWASRNLTGGRFTPCHRDPPLPYPDSYFDLVVAVSVFTHLTRAYQEQWLKELQRVTAANAIVVASTHGEPACRWMFHQPGEWEKRMLTGFSDEIQDNGLGPVASGDYYRGTFQTVAYTRELWGQYFDVIVHDEGGLSNLQDIYVLRKKASAR